MSDYGPYGPYPPYPKFKDRRSSKRSTQAHRKENPLPFQNTKPTPGGPDREQHYFPEQSGSGKVPTVTRRRKQMSSVPKISNNKPRDLSHSALAATPINTKAQEKPALPRKPKQKPLLTRQLLQNRQNRKTQKLSFEKTEEERPSLMERLKEMGVMFNETVVTSFPNPKGATTPTPCIYCKNAYTHIHGFCPARMPPSLRFQKCVDCQGFHPSNMCPLAFQIKLLEASSFCNNCNLDHSGYCEVEYHCNNCFTLHRPGLICETDTSRIDHATGIEQCVSCKIFHLGTCSFGVFGNTFRYCNSCKFKHEQGKCAPTCPYCRYRHFGFCSLQKPLWPCTRCIVSHAANEPCRTYSDTGLYCNNCHSPAHDSSVNCNDFRQKPYNFADRKIRNLKAAEKFKEECFPHIQFEEHPAGNYHFTAGNNKENYPPRPPSRRELPFQGEPPRTSTPLPQTVPSKDLPFSPDQTLVSISEAELESCSNISNLSTLRLDSISTMGETTLNIMNEVLEQSADPTM